MNNSTATRFRTIQCGLGTFAVIQSGDGSLRSTWMSLEEAVEDGGTRDRTMLPDLFARLRAYFAGDPVSFDDIETPVGSDFHRRCWEACRAIPPGSTISYANLAEQAGSSAAASRAAGQAMRRNPLPVIVPCHRVIGSDGRLHGFSGSMDPRGQALTLKQALLELERRSVRARTELFAPAALAC